MAEAVEPTGIIFDWDGTVVDSGEALLLSYRHAYRSQLGIDFPRDMAQFRRILPMRATESAARYGGHKAAEIVAAYEEYYNAEAYTVARVFPGLLEALVELKGRGYRVAVASNKGLGRVLKDMDHLRLHGVFDVIVTAEDTLERKPHPAALLKAAEKLGLAPECCAYVGDYPGDVQAARAAGMTAIAVLWGGIFPEEELRPEHPDHLLVHPSQLLEVYPERRVTGSAV